ncbi:MAG: phosphomannomutase [Alphaproteobacteria bacterium]|nr:phosphomannomutase [Alphaproteobacteria bacterium]
MKSHRFAPQILREYDIRGTVGETLSEDDAFALGRTFGAKLRSQDGRLVCVGYDGRLSSPALEARLVDGLCTSGMRVLRIGLGPTPALYFATRAMAADGGIMVTGSHNPPDHNGFKMMLGAGPFWGQDIQNLGDVAAQGAWVDGDGAAQEIALIDAYVARLRMDYTTTRGLKVAWDAGNGAAGEAMSQLTAQLPGEHILLNAEIDGTFPAHHPDPTVPENLKQLQEAVATEGCDLGIAFDGDGDRIGVIDGEGRILWGDQLLSIYARDLLSRRSGATVIADVKASQVLFDEIERYGGEPVMAATGHSIIKSRMAELSAPLAGEMSGHIFFADHYYGFDDALYAAVRLLDIVARSDRNLAAMRDALPQVVNTPEIRFDVPEDRKFDVVDEVKARLAKTNANVNDTDGVRVLGDDGWWLLRASNTQAVLVVRCESQTDDGLGRLKTAVAEQLRLSGVDAPAF